MNQYRLCNHSKFVFWYWLENIYNKLTENQKKIIYNYKKNLSEEYTNNIIKYGDRFFCKIPDKYKNKNYNYVENGCYWD